jgi:Photosynthesis system II assembly factor YCF48
MQDVPKIVINRLQTTISVDPHPEPALLAAFAEQSLNKHERQQVMNHVSGCAACREVLALASPWQETARRSIPLQVRVGWLSRPLLRWSFAGVGTLAVLAVAILQYDQRKRPNAAEVSSAQPAQLAASSLQSFPAASNASEPSARSASKLPIQGRQGLPPSNARALRQPSVETSVKNSALPESTESGGVATASNRSSDALVGSQAPVGSPYQTLAKADVMKAKPAVAAQSPPGSGPIAAAPPAMPLQTSPSLMMRASPRWSITATGGLQRSFDAGKTWEGVSISVANEQIQPQPGLRVVTAIGPEVWVGGSAAVLYHSADSGNRWLQVFPSSGGIAPTGDISRIEFSDPQNGKVRTSTGEIWITSDGGLTWQKLP